MKKRSEKNEEKAKSNSAMRSRYRKKNKIGCEYRDVKLAAKRKSYEAEV